MGFPLGYSELLLPRLLLQMFFLLSSIRRLISCAFTFFGLDDLLLDSDYSPTWPDNYYNSSSSINSYPFPIIHQNHPQSPFSAAASLMIQETLPVVRFQDLPSASIGDSCAVCLYELGSDDEVRLLSNCRHVFHRCCLDRWTEHEQITCPLCRMPLLPEAMTDDFHDRMWAAANHDPYPPPPTAPTAAAELDGYSSLLISAY